MKLLTGMARNLLLAYNEEDQTFLPLAEIILQVTERNTVGGDPTDTTIRFMASQKTLGELARYLTDAYVDIAKEFGKKEDK